MLKPFYFVILIASLVSFIQRGNCQSDYKPFGVIFSDKDVTVELQYRINDPCIGNGNGKKSKFRYNIIGHSKGYDLYLNWKMDYHNCNDKVIRQTNFINIGNFQMAGIVEDMDYNFPGNSIVVPFHSVYTSSTPDKSQSSELPVKSEAPTSIEGDLEVNYNQKTTLTLKGGVLGYKCQWKWYKNKCDGIPVGTGATITINPTQTEDYFVRAEGPSETNCISARIKVNLFSIAADHIDGKAIVCKTESNIPLAVRGGVLGQGADWVWYKDSLKTQPVGKGANILVSPSKTTVYLVRAEGIVNNTEEKKIVLKVVTDSLKEPNGIVGDNSICKGNSINLKVTGGWLSDGAQWFWYQHDISNGNIIGKGTFISVTPNENSKYLVRAEGACKTSAEVSFAVKVSQPSIIGTGIYTTTDQKNRRKTHLILNGGYLADDSKWKWYKNSCGTGRFIGEGSSISLKVKKQFTVYVRGEGNCGTTNCLRATLYPTMKDWKYTFINFGLIPNFHIPSGGSSGRILQEGLKKITDNPIVSLTFGSYKQSGWYLRGKYNISYKTSSYDIQADQSININNVNNYYIYDGKITENRIGITAGFITRLNERSLFFTLGGGYGSRELLWNVREYRNQDNSFQKEGWGKSTSASFSGLEAECGLMLKLSFLNLMVGVNGIIPSNSTSVAHDYKYFIDSYIGLGFTF